MHKQTREKNALSHDMYFRLAELFNEYGNLDACSSIILYGADNIFTAGADLNDFKIKRESGDSPGVTFLRAISKANVPVIAAVEGFAVGIGSTLLQHCDFVYTNAKVRFRMPFVALGLCPEGASTYLLEHMVGSRYARDWLMTGRFFSGQEAFEAGLVTELVNEGTALEKARSTAELLSSLPAKSLRTTKRMMNDWHRDNIQTAFDNEVAMFAELLASGDTQSQISATGKTE